VVSYSPQTEIALGAEGIHKVEYFSMDNSGNVEQIKSSFIKLDLTKPEIFIRIPASQNYLHSNRITIDYQGQDKLSGILFLSASIDGTPVRNFQEIDMSGLSVGSHEFMVTASDVAGNFANRKIIFNVVSNIESLIALNNRAQENHWITDSGTARSLGEKLNFAKQALDAGQKEKANKIVASYIHEIDSHTANGITAEGAHILTTEAAYVYLSNV
jgi:hypothetical protein